MPKEDDPYYNRNRVPDTLTKDVGVTGLTAAEEYDNRERKYSANGSDVRKFSNWLYKPNDPYYRKPVPDTLTAGVGETGLTATEEYENRERKYSQNGEDLRHFSKWLNKPNDPYYRKSVPDALTAGIGETGNTAAEDYAVRERKQSVAMFSGDPFSIISGSGHRQSISAAAVGASADATRRRSSAVGPDAARATANVQGQHSGYDGDEKLAPIVSRNELPPVNQDRITGDGPTSYDTSQTQHTTQQNTTTSVPSGGATTEGYKTGGTGAGGYTSGTGTGTTGTGGYTSGAGTGTGTTGTGGYTSGIGTATTGATGTTGGNTYSSGGYTGGADTSNTTTSNTYSSGGYTGGTDTSNTGASNTYTGDGNYSGSGTYTGGGNYTSHTYSGTNTSADQGTTGTTGQTRTGGHTSYYSAATQQD